MGTKNVPIVVDNLSLLAVGFFFVFLIGQFWEWDYGSISLGSGILHVGLHVGLGLWALAICGVGDFT